MKATLAAAALLCAAAAALARAAEDDVTALLQMEVAVDASRPERTSGALSLLSMLTTREEDEVMEQMLAPSKGDRASLAQLSSEAKAEAVPDIEVPKMDKHSWLIVIICIESFVLFVTMGLPIALWAIAAFLGRSIKFGIETCDRLFIGTDVTINKLETNIFQGVIFIDTLEVQNPEAGKYDSPYLLRAGVVHIDLDMWALVCSFFRHVKIEKLEFKQVDVIYEKGWQSSNVQDVLGFLKGKGSGSTKAAVEGSKEADGSEPQNESRIGVTLHEVMVEDVGARVQAQMLGGRGMRVSVGDIGYKDFAEEVGESTMGPIIQVLLKSVLKTVIVNVAGKQVGERCM